MKHYFGRKIMRVFEVIGLLMILPVMIAGVAFLTMLDYLFETGPYEHHGWRKGF